MIDLHQPCAVYQQLLFKLTGLESVWMQLRILEQIDLLPSAQIFAESEDFAQAGTAQQKVGESFQIQSGIQVISKT